MERNNSELVATWGDLANRMLSFVYKRFDGHVSEPGPLDDEDRALLAKVEAGFDTVGELYNACKFRSALGEAMALAREANVYLDRKAPWFQIKKDNATAATSVYVILRVVDNLKTLLAPILPDTAQQRHEYLGYEGQLIGTQHVIEYHEETRSHRALTYDHAGAIGTWAPSALLADQPLRQPAPLFKKLDESVVEDEYARLKTQSNTNFNTDAFREPGQLPRLFWSDGASREVLGDSAAGLNVRMQNRSDGRRRRLRIG